MSKFIKRAVGFGVPFVEIPAMAKQYSSAPTSSDTNFQLGYTWVYANGNNRTVYIYGGKDSNGDGVWSLASPGASDVDTLTGDSGGALSPTAGNITIAGGTNVTTAGAASTITVNLDAAITLATSVSSPLYTVAAATDLAITSAAGQDIVLKMGDAAGANKVSFLDSADAEVFAIDSNGAVTFGAITVTDFTSTGTAQDIGNSNSATTIQLGKGTGGNTISVNAGINTGANVVNIATGAAAGNSTVSVLSGAATAGTSTLNLNTGTGAITRNTNIGTGAAVVNGINIGGTGANVIAIGNTQTGGSVAIGDAMTTGTISIGGTGAQTGTITISASTGTQAINIAATDGTKTIAIGNGVDGNQISIGNGVNTSSQTISIGNGASASDSIVNILSGVGTAGAGTLALGNNTRVTTIGLGDIAPAAARAVTICGGDSAQNDTLSIMSDNPSAGTQTVSILAGVPTGGTQVLNLLSQTGQAGTVNIATGAGMANNINIGGTGANVIALGNTQTTGSIAIGDALTSGTIAIGGSGANTGTITIAGGTGAQTLNIANSTGGKTVAIASGAGANAVTIGSTNTTSSLVLQAGSGEITVTGTVKEISAEFLEASGDEITAFSQSPLMTTAANTGGVATGSNGDVNLMYCQQGVLMEQFIIGTQTIIAPRMDSNGLLISLDLTAAEGAEYNFGAARTNSRHAFTIGTSAAFFFEVGLRINDMDGADPYVIGFRKSEANNATLSSYTDYAAIGMLATSSPTNVVILSELNSGGQTVTDTTDAWGGDGTTKTLKVLVSAAGVVTFTIDGVAASAAPSFTFDNADVVVPFIHLLHSASATAVNITSLKVGFQA